MIIAFIGFGEAARAFHETLHAQNPALNFIAYDILLDDGETAPAMRMAMEQRGVEVAANSAGLSGADWIVSAVTADQSLIAARSVLGVLGQGMVFADINSVSPGRSCWRTRWAR